MGSANVSCQHTLLQLCYNTISIISFADIDALSTQLTSLHIAHYASYESIHPCMLVIYPDHSSLLLVAWVINWLPCACEALNLVTVGCMCMTMDACLSVLLFVLRRWILWRLWPWSRGIQCNWRRRMQSYRNRLPRPRKYSNNRKWRGRMSPIWYIIDGNATVCVLRTLFTIVSFYSLCYRFHMVKVWYYMLSVA